MQVTVLLENTARDDMFATEHGLSLYLETARHKILFDMGQTDAFARNARLLGIDLRAVDLAVLSHGHYDHGGGLEAFLDINDHAPVYVSRHAFGAFYSRGGEKYSGLSQMLRGNPRFKLCEGDVQIDEELSLHDGTNHMIMMPSWCDGLFVRRDGLLVQDDFCHEQELLVQEDGRRIVFSGCAHKGVCNIVSWLQPDVFVGGFHLSKLAGDDARLAQAAQILCAGSTCYVTGHCTGQAPYAYLKDCLKQRLSPLYTGAQFTI